MSNTHLTTTTGTPPAMPCNILIDVVPCGTLENVCQTLSMLACMPTDGLTKHSAMGVYWTLIECENALQFEIDRATKSNTTEERQS